MKPVLKLILVCSVAISFGPRLFSQDKYVHDFQLTGIETDLELINAASNVVPSARQLTYHQEEFIGFIHFGPNTFTGREWGNGKEDAQVFAPAIVNTDNWCETMKAAGMAKVIITVKHHDGFCLWQTRYNDVFSVKSSPWKDGQGDVLRMLSDSCKKYGLKLGVYLSPADLYQIESKDGLYGNQSEKIASVIPTNPDSFQSDPSRQRKTQPDMPTFEVIADDYNRYFMNQLYELLTEYGTIHEVWFDGAHPKRKGGQTYMKPEWFKMIRRLQPNAVIFGGPDIRWCGNEHGGTRESEWNVLLVGDEAVSGKDRPDKLIGTDEELLKREYSVYGEKHQGNFLYYLISEVDTSIRNGWFWRNEHEQNVRSADELFDIYERCVGGNAVFLLNVPPNNQGVFGERDRKALIELGKRIRATYSNNLLSGHRSEFGNLDDDDIDSFDQMKDKSGQFVIELDQPQTINRFMIQEAISKVGQRVKNHVVDVWQNGGWKEVSSAGVIGYKRIHRFPAVETQKIRVRVLDARNPPGISEVGAYFYLAPPLPVVIQRAGDNVELYTRPLGHDASAVNSQEIRFTLDGSEPTIDSKIYQQPIALPQGGIVSARSVVEGELGEVNRVRLGISTKDWKVTATSEHVGFEASKAIDGDPITMWHTSWANGHPGHPHTLTIELAAPTQIVGMTYLPRQDRKIPDAMIEDFEVSVSEDGSDWSTIANGSFGNILNDPSQRLFLFDQPVVSTWFRLTSKSGAQGKPYAGAAEIGLLAK